MGLTQRSRDGNWSVEFQVAGKRYVRSLHTRDLQLAHIRSRQVKDEALKQARRCQDQVSIGEVRALCECCLEAPEMMTRRLGLYVAEACLVLIRMIEQSDQDPNSITRIHEPERVQQGLEITKPSTEQLEIRKRAMATGRQEKALSG